MSLEGLFLVLCGVCAMAGHSIIQRWAQRDAVPILGKRQILLAQHGLSALFLLTVCVLSGLDLTAVQPAIFWIGVAGTTLFNIGIQYANVESLRLGEASLVKPIQALTPGLVVFAAMVLGEVPSPQGMVGIVLISVGVYVHAREDAKTLAEWLLPLTFLFLPRHYGLMGETERRQVRRKIRALRWAFLSACLGTGGLVCDAFVARHGSVALGFLIQSVCLTGVFALLVSNNGGHQPLIFPRPKLWRQPIFAAMVLGGLYFLHILFVMTAFRFGQVAYIGALKRLSIVLIGLLSWWLLSERRGKRRLIPISVITAGAVLLAFDSTIQRFISLLEGQ